MIKYTNTDTVTNFLRSHIKILAKSYISFEIPTSDCRADLIFIQFEFLFNLAAVLMQSNLLKPEIRFVLPDPFPSVCTYWLTKLKRTIQNVIYAKEILHY